MRHEVGAHLSATVAGLTGDSSSTASGVLRGAMARLVSGVRLSRTGDAVLKANGRVCVIVMIVGVWVGLLAAFAPLFSSSRGSGFEMLRL